MLKDDKATRNMSQVRRMVCEVCPKRNKFLDQCNECGCFLPAKTRVKDAACPLQLW
jgi:hypothetical protein